MEQEHFTEALKHEHRAVEEALGVLERMAGKLEKGKAVDPELVEKTLDFLRTFADRCHHGKEADLLFPAMEMKGVSRKDSPIGTLIREHEIARNLLRNLELALHDYREGDETAGEDIGQNSEAYVELLRRHIEREDEVLYPMAEERMTQEEQEQLLKAYDRFEHEIVGEGVHERYHHMMEGLKERV